ncbi:hypothetical protein ACROYT_G008708 [Oculina patagonica]
MKTSMLLIILFVLAVYCTTFGDTICKDRLRTSLCKYLIDVYHQKSVECCKWKSMKTNCAQTCKECEPKSKCSTRASKYGCCWDKITEATGYYGEGCPECKDRYPSYCQRRISRFSEARACNVQGEKYCPKSCDVCKERAAAQAVPDCVHSPYGCCWDLTAAQGPNGEGCRVCKDRMRTSTCKYLINVYGHKGVECCKWESMKNNCAQTCKQCVPKPKCATPASRYGCCWDKKTEATGYYGEGCPECKDRNPSYCRRRISKYSKARACNVQGKKYCPKSCDVCQERAAAQAVPDCVYSPYGCCWDLTAAQGPNGEGCRECRNLYTNLCIYWSDFCESDALRYGKRTVEMYRVSCPVTCKKCQPGQKLLKASAYERQ